MSKSESVLLLYVVAVSAVLFFAVTNMNIDRTELNIIEACVVQDDR